MYNAITNNPVSIYKSSYKPTHLIYNTLQYKRGTNSLRFRSKFQFPI